MLIDRAIYRVKQFYFSMFSRYTKADEAFAKSYLNIHEIALFNQLPGFEKKHCVIVARKMLDASHLYPQLDQRKLVRLGLLHDIGKVFEHNSIPTKSVLVIIRFFLPGLFNWLADRGEHDHRFRKFYVHKHHGKVGVEILSRMGESSEILAMIAKHDPRVAPLGTDDPIELRLLQQMDSSS